MSSKLSYLKILFIIVMVLFVSAWNDIGNSVKAKDHKFTQRDGLLYKG